jgi:Fe-S oxidoreductase
VAVFRDELVGMLPHDEDAKRLSLQTLTVPEFLQRHCEGWDAPRRDGRVVVHGHCHQKAVMGMDDERALLERLGLEVEMLDSGCCGLAGSFGFEASHHELSVQIARDRLLPLLDRAPTDALVVADGFSCKTQIEALSAHRPAHAVQVVAESVRARTQMVR